VDAPPKAACHGDGKPGSKNCDLRSCAILARETPTLPTNTLLSACIVTFNEEHNLARALNSLAGIADEIVVVDSGSTDRTADIAREHGVSFFSRAFTNHADQKNYAASLAKNDWIFLLDADEEPDQLLRESLRVWKQRTPDFFVYEMARLTNYLGAWIRHSRWYPDFQRRLYRRDKANFSGMIHSALHFSGAVGRLDGNLLHYTMRNFAEHEAKVERYTTVMAAELYSQGRRDWRAAMWFATPWSWFQNYILYAGFLDGYRGLLIARMAARSTRLKFAKLGQLINSGKSS
jgi:glycosyltransferase involved in cell wall biosynthesis